jgi:general secretion pathway protein B
MPAAEAAPEDVDEELPMLWELPRDFSLSVPEIRMSLHIYDPQASTRFVRVNKRKFREGDWVADGLLLEEITPEGAVFAFDGTRFRVERP